MEIGAVRRKRMSAPMLSLKKHWQLYLLILVPLTGVAIFAYGPMYGVIIAFKNFVPGDGIWGSKWVGLAHFQSFLGSYEFPRLIKNTLGLSLYALAAGFPIPIIFAVLINECRGIKFKKTVQMATYAPYFISSVILVSIVMLMLSPRSGVLTQFFSFFNGGKMIDYMSSPAYFKSIYVWSKVWQEMGFNAVIYIAALAGIDPSLQEAAVVDGASRVQKIWHVDLPSIAPTVVILLIVSVGSIMSMEYEKVLLLQNDLNMSSSDIISTFVYRMGIAKSQYSFATAVNLFNSVINAVLLVTVNQVAKKLGDTSLW